MDLIKYFVVLQMALHLIKQKRSGWHVGIYLFTTQVLDGPNSSISTDHVATQSWFDSKHVTHLVVRSKLFEIGISIVRINEVICIISSHIYFAFSHILRE